MAATYTPKQALDFATSMIKGMILSSDTAVNAQICDYVLSAIWMAAPFRWTVGSYSATPIAVTAGTSDYTVTAPSDYLSIEKAYIVTTDSINELTPVSILVPDVNVVGVPSKIDYVAANTLRIHPKPSTGYSGQLYIIYKKKHPVINSGNLNTAGAIVIDDDWYWVFQLGVMWQAYMYADDQRAGTATVDAQGRIQYTGAYGAFRAGIETMKVAENATLDYPGTVHNG